MKEKKKFPLLDTGVLSLGFVVWLLISSVLLVVAAVALVLPYLLPQMAAAGRAGGGEDLANDVLSLTMNPYLLYGVTGAAELMLVVPLAVYLAVKKVPVKALLGNRVSAAQCALAALAGLLLSPAMLGLEALSAALLQALGATIPDTSALNPRTLGAVAAGMVAIGLTAGVVEEPVFRGVALRGLGGALGKWAAILVSSLLFALVHMEPVGMLVRFLVGVVLGMMAWRCGSILPGVFAHAAFNTSSLLTAYVLTVPLGGWQGFLPNLSPGANGTVSQVLLSLPFLLACAGAYLLFARSAGPNAAWSDRPHDRGAATGVRLLPWVGAFVVTAGLTLCALAALWLPSLQDMLSALETLPR